MILKKTAKKELEYTASTLSTEFGKAKAQLETLETNVESTKKALLDTRTTLKDVESELSDKQNTRRALNTEIAEAEDKLESVTREVRLFPSEIAGFVKEGNRSIIHYIILSIPFTLIIGYVTFALFSSAIDLTQLWREQEDIDIWVVFLSRLPFVLVAITILEVCGYIIGRFIFEILRINRQRLKLSKLSIIAKDVSTASAHMLDLTPEEAFDQEKKLKMELLREHMKEDIGDDFS